MLEFRVSSHPPARSPIQSLGTSCALSGRRTDSSDWTIDARCRWEKKALLLDDGVPSNVEVVLRPCIIRPPPPPPNVHSVRKSYLSGDGVCGALRIAKSLMTARRDGAIPSSIWTAKLRRTAQGFAAWVLSDWCAEAVGRNGYGGAPKPEGRSRAIPAAEYICGTGWVQRGARANV